MIGLHSSLIGHVHNFYEILYVFSGKRILTANNSSVTLDRQTVAFVPPYVFHHTKRIPGEEYKRILINFAFDFIKSEDYIKTQRLLACFQTPYNTITFPEHLTGYIYNLFQNILHEYNSANDEYYTDMLKTLITQLLISASRSNVDTKNNMLLQRNHSHYHVIQNITSYLQNNFSQKITLDSLQEQFSLSKYSISREFKLFNGISFVDFLNAVRIEQAQKHLKYTTKTITDISFECGFDSVIHFNRIFKMYASCTPSEYRKTHSISYDMP